MVGGGSIDRPARPTNRSSQGASTAHPMLQSPTSAHTTRQACRGRVCHLPGAAALRPALASGHPPAAAPRPTMASGHPPASGRPSVSAIETNQTSDGAQAVRGSTDRPTRPTNRSPPGTSNRSPDAAVTPQRPLRPDKRAEVWCVTSRRRRTPPRVGQRPPTRRRTRPTMASGDPPASGGPNVSAIETNQTSDGAQAVRGGTARPTRPTKRSPPPPGTSTAHPTLQSPPTAHSTRQARRGRVCRLPGAAAPRPTMTSGHPPASGRPSVSAIETNQTSDGR